MPRGIPNKTTSSEDNKVGQDKALLMPTSGPLSEMIRTDQQIEVVDGPSLGDYAAELAFNEEFVDVVVHESTNPNDQMLVDLYCNGTPQRFIRGATQKVRRKFVAILAQARQTSIKTTAAVNGEETVNRIDKHTAVRYPFSVVNDPNPRGRDWLRQMLAAA